MCPRGPFEAGVGTGQLHSRCGTCRHLTLVALVLAPPPSFLRTRAAFLCFPNLWALALAIPLTCLSDSPVLLTCPSPCSSLWNPILLK